MKVKSSKLIKSPIPNPQPHKAAFLWDESFLWGLMAYKALKANGLSFQLIRAEDIKKGRLKNYAMLFVPGGWASNKLKALGDKGIAEIKKFVSNGGNYLGFCGGAGLATLDGMGLLDIKRMPTKDRVPSFSGRIHLNINKHQIWKHLEQSAVSHQLSAVSKLLPNPQSLIPIFNAWWPSQFLVLAPHASPLGCESSRLTNGRNRGGIKILATYGNALPDSFSSDLNVGDVEMNSNWSELEEIYGINLNPKRLKDEPAVIEGAFGKGRVILSLIHFDTPDDKNGALVLRNLWNYLAGKQSALNSQRSAKNSKLLIHSRIMSNNYCNLVIPAAPAGLLLACPESFLGKDSRQAGVTEKEKSSLNELETAVNDLISLGIRNFLWFWRNPMLLQWRRGVRGLEYCTLYVMVKELSAISSQQSDLNKIKELLIPFVEKVKQLLILERHAMQTGHIPPLIPPLLRGGLGGEIPPEIHALRTELFGNSKSHGGLFKELINRADNLLYLLIKQNGTKGGAI